MICRFGIPHKCVTVATARGIGKISKSTGGKVGRVIEAYYVRLED